jgi:V/A-type H+-transporting ATPase subunit B
LASIIGAEELSDSDRQYLNFADQFEKRFVRQEEEEERSIVGTLGLAWDLLSLLPRTALIRVTEADLDKYHKWEGNAGQEVPKEKTFQESASEES